MIETLWDLTKTPYYQFIVVKEPELIEQWREYHKVTENTSLAGVYPSNVEKGSAFHILKSHIPYKCGVMSTYYFAVHNGLNRTAPHQYYPLEDYDTLVEVYDEPTMIPETDEAGKPVFEDGVPKFQEYHPIRHVSLTAEWLKDFTESQAEHKVQKNPSPPYAWIEKFIPFILLIVGAWLFLTQILPMFYHG